MMSIGSTERQGLTRSLDGIFEKFGIEQTIVRVIVFDEHSVALCDPFKRPLCLNRVFHVQFCHQVNIDEVGKMVHEHGGPNISFDSRSTMVIRYESRCWTDELIHAHYFSWFTCFSQSLLLSFHSMR